jgi:hypothetical protein
LHILTELILSLAYHHICELCIECVSSDLLWVNAIHELLGCTTNIKEVEFLEIIAKE